MEEFKVIESQEALDAIIEKRLRREREKYSDYDEIKAKADKYDDLEQTTNSRILELETIIQEKDGKYTDFDNQINQLTGDNQKLRMSEMKTRVAYAHGIPFDLAQRLSGDDEESLIQDAQALSSYIKGPSYVAPLKDTDAPSDNRAHAYQNLLNVTETGE
ncbi:hypothetical protein [Erysipelothrix aquatica]|uniref:hypothetical protein n=1 Tax=Erysipelothrix aquatica TaxID=2683714 RepID=UPI00135C3AD5|nr:hypothetical protein [Erysipelothrix aquatica]